MQIFIFIYIFQSRCTFCIFSLENFPANQRCKITFQGILHLSLEMPLHEQYYRGDELIKDLESQ